MKEENKASESADGSPDPDLVDHSETLGDYLTSVILNMAIIVGSCQECCMNEMN